MLQRPASPAPFWNPPTVVAVGLALAAVVAALGAHLAVMRAQRLADAVAVQRSITLGYEDRALFCLDRAAAQLEDPAAALRAQRSLNISRGITLCLVGSREDARVDAEALDGCIRRLEADNLVPGRSAAAPPHPAC